MKQLIKNYSFSSTAKTVTLTDFSTLHLERLQAIIDTTQNKFLYNLVDATVASATVAGNVITLSSVNGASSSDTLEIIYDCLTGDPTYDTPVLPSNAAQEGGGNLATIAANTGSLVTPLIDKAYDYVGMSNPDGNGNYQTIVFKSGGSGGTTMRTLTLSYDANSNVTSITRT